MTRWTAGDRTLRRRLARIPLKGFVNRKVLQRVFGSPDPKALADLQAQIADDSVRVHGDRPVRLVFFDSFDWRLFRRGWTLVQDGAEWHLCDRETGLDLCSLKGPTSPARFARDLPAGEMHDYLAKALKVRALLHLVTVVGTARCDEYTDPRTRRVWRLTYGDLRLDKRDQELSFLHTVSLEPVNGRDSGGKRVTRLVRGVGLSALPATLLEAALARVGLPPAAYSNRVRVPLDPDLSAQEAFVRLAACLQTTMKANVKGIVRDIDSEFLHDFRVAARRLRCLLALCKKALPKDLQRRHNAHLKELGAVTGPVRDLDVYLLHRARYRNLVQPELLTGLDEIMARSAQLRAVRHDELVRFLTDPGYAAAVKAWDTVLSEGTTTWLPAAKGAGQPLRKLAAKQVTATYARVLKRGAAVADPPKDRELHRLRIACKEHRYALEFFASLYSRRAVTTLISPLKQVQDLLGDHNDLVVHSRHLRRLAAADGAEALSPVGAAAAEDLITRLAAAKTDLRRRFAETYAIIASAKTQKLVHKMNAGL